jgi:hypothetical protein
MTVGGYTNFDKLKERKKIHPIAKMGRAKIDLDEMGNPIKRERSMLCMRERAKKPIMKKEPKMLTIYFRLLKKRIPPVTDPNADQDEDNIDPESKTQAIPEVESPFSRQVQVGEKARVK